MKKAKHKIWSCIGGITLALLAGTVISWAQNAPQPVSQKANATIKLAHELKNLEFTGQYAVRYLRVPADKGLPARIIRFEIPVFKEKTAGTDGRVDGEQIINAQIVN